MSHINLLFILVLTIFCSDAQYVDLTEELVYPENSLEKRTVSKESKEKIDFFKICEEGLGCIETDQTWYHEEYRPVNLRPLERHLIKSDFLYIKKPIPEQKELTYIIFQPRVESIKKSGFKNDSELIIMIHDFTSNGYTGWIKHLCGKVLSSSIDYNLVSINWEKGAEPPYDQAIANARITALEVIIFIKELKDKFNYSLDNVHIIGHGVGAHIAGYIGNTYSNIKKITGLDPSGPRFEGMPYNVKLNPNSSKYVEIIHTDYHQTRSQGINETLGHSDFYINPDDGQPGCFENKTFNKLINVQRGSLKEGEILPGCSHKRAFKYFIESINNKNCTFQGIRCNSYEDFKEGKCTSCSSPGRDCRVFGLKTYKDSSINNMFFLNTAAQSPFCMLEYRITVYIKDDEKIGFFDFIFIDENAAISAAHLSYNYDKYNFRVLKGGSKFGDVGNTFVYFAPPPKLRNIRELKIRWNEKRKIYCILFCKQTVTVKTVAVSFLGTQQEDTSESMVFCPNNKKYQEIENEVYVSFKRCNEDKLTTSTSTMPSTHVTQTHTETSLSSTSSIIPNTSHITVKSTTYVSTQKSDVVDLQFKESTTNLMKNITNNSSTTVKSTTQISTRKPEVDESVSWMFKDEPLKLTTVELITSTKLIPDFFEEKPVNNINPTLFITADTFTFPPYEETTEYRDDNEKDYVDNMNSITLDVTENNELITSSLTFPTKIDDNPKSSDVFPLKSADLFTLNKEQIKSIIKHVDGEDMSPTLPERPYSDDSYAQLNDVNVKLLKIPGQL